MNVVSQRVKFEVFRVLSMHIGDFFSKDLKQLLHEVLSAQIG